MSDFIYGFFGIIIAFPFLIPISLLILFRIRGKVPKRMIGVVADITTPFLFVAVFIVSQMIFGTGIGFYIAMIAIIILIAFAVVERIKVKEFQIVNLLRKTWRLFFLLLASAYIILLIVGLVVKIVEYAY